MIENLAAAAATTSIAKAALGRKLGFIRHVTFQPCTRLKNPTPVPALTTMLPVYG